MVGISAARKAAYRILLAVERGEGHSDDLLRTKAVNALAAADRNLATALVLGVLRWQMRLDEAIRPLLKRPDAKLDVEARVALRMGVFQLLYLDRIPAHAAIDESVELVKQAGHRFAAGMVNAVLRRVAASGSDRDGEFSVLEEDFNAAYPAWLVERWERIFGVERTCAICKRGQQAPSVAVRLTDEQAEDELSAAGVRLEPGTLLTAARTVAVGDVTATEAFGGGRVRIQDEGSQLVAEIAACALGLSHPSSTERLMDGAPIFKAGSEGQNQNRILDACAAPGGKTLILAERLRDAQIVACEVSAPRLEAMRARLAGVVDRVECRLADATELTDEGEFDLVLADVPCSGTGTLGRNPEIRHRLREEDLTRQAERQRAILRGALRAVNPGGRVVYSTCSLEPEENEQVVAAVGARVIPMSECLAAMRRDGILTDDGAQELEKCVTAEGMLRLMPGALGTDGFFVAVLERV